MGQLYGRERFQPGKICGQIAVLQALFYAAFAFSTFFGSFLVGLPWAFNEILDPEEYTAFTPLGWCMIAGVFITSFATAAVLPTVIERAKKALDFVFTAYFLHFLLSAFAFGFPWNGTWWLVHSVAFILSAALGEYLCLRREMADISVDDLVSARRARMAAAAAAGRRAMEAALHQSQSMALQQQHQQQHHHVADGDTRVSISIPSNVNSSNNSKNKHFLFSTTSVPAETWSTTAASTTTTSSYHNGGGIFGGLEEGGVGAITASRERGGSSSSGSGPNSSNGINSSSSSSIGSRFGGIGRGIFSGLNGIRGYSAVPTTAVAVFNDITDVNEGSSSSSIMSMVRGANTGVTALTTSTPASANTNSYHQHQYSKSGGSGSGLPGTVVFTTPKKNKGGGSGGAAISAMNQLTRGRGSSASERDAILTSTTSTTTASTTTNVYIGGGLRRGTAVPLGGTFEFSPSNASSAAAIAAAAATRERLDIVAPMGTLDYDASIKK